MLDEIIFKNIFESFNESIIHYTSNIGLVDFDTYMERLEHVAQSRERIVQILFLLCLSLRL